MQKRLVARYIASFLVLLCSHSGLAFSQQSGKPYLDNYNVQKIVVARHAGVASAHPLASKVGLYILQQGGNAVDAAIAVQLALAVVYPQAGNIGGGGFMVMHLADGRNMALDFREKAPASAHRDMYLDSAGKPLPGKSLAGHLASGVPGTIAGIFESMRYAGLPLAKLIQPAIDLAEKGYVITPGIADDTGFADPKYNTRPNVFDGSRQWKAGDRFTQPDLANTLKRIRDNGRKEFYEGQTARLIVVEMQRGGGNITLQDLKNYQAKWREPVTFDYRRYSIVSMPLPSSGGILLNQMLKMIEPFPIASYGFGSAQAISLMTEAERRAYKDRAAYLGDGDFSTIPVAKLTSDSYLKEQMADYIPGKAGVSRPIGTGTLQPESKETTHFSIVDKDGNAVAVTTTLNTPYGSQVVVGGAGFFLNNEMNDFSLKPGERSASGGVGGVANSIEPGKRMLSSMTPTIVLKDGKLFMVVGSPGGTTIPTSVFQTIVNVIDFNMTSADAVSKPKFHHEWMPDFIAMERSFPQESIAALKAMGYLIREGYSLGEVELIKVREDGNLDVIADNRSSSGAEGY
jgi:gamma-glutamyltranspeptidase/glutathione hydrolase